MARVSHKKIKQLIAQKQSKITDRQFFTSRILATHFADIAAAQTRRYGYRRRVKVDIRWEPKKLRLAYTDNLLVHINAGNPLVTKQKAGRRGMRWYGGTAAEEDLRGIKHEYQRKGIIFVAAAIGADKENIERIYGDAYLDITDLTKLPIKLAGIIKQFIRF